MANLLIKNLHATVDDKKILNGINLEIKPGEVHVIMGPNGAGKSTLSQVIMGHPNYKITEGEIKLNGESIISKEVDQRAKMGLFLSMQYPSEIAGITNSDFIRTASVELNEESESLIKFAKRMNTAISDLKMDPNMAQRYLNEGFSGGEKKKNEILQMKMLKPKIAILDEIDSGLDIDALNVVGNALNEEIKNRKDEFSMLLITHYQRLLDYIKPTHIHILVDGKIVKTADGSLAKELEQTGYDKYIQNTNNKSDEKKPKSLGACATNLGVNNGK